MYLYKHGALFTNGEALEYLQCLAQRSIEPISRKIANSVYFETQKEARRKFPLTVPGDGHTCTCVEDDKIKVSGVTMVLHDESLDENERDKPVNAEYFMDCMFAVLHEVRHVEQALVLSCCDDAWGNLLFLTNVGMTDNPGYKNIDNIYFYDSSEVDAQHIAMRRGYALLSASDGFDGVNASEYVLSYQARRHANLSIDYVPKPGGGRYGSVEDLFDAFKTAFIESVHHSRPSKFLSMLFGKDSIDMFFRKHPGSYIQFIFEKDGYKQLEMAAAVHYETCYERVLDGRGPILRNAMLERIKNDREMDLSLSATFGTSVLQRFGSSTPRPGEYGDKAVACFKTVMCQVKRSGLLTEQEKSGQDGPGDGSSGG